MPIKKCTLDGSALRSLDDLYDQLAGGLALPKHFGRNLDALWDVLSADVPGPFEIVWKHADDSKKALGRDFDRVLKVLRELEKERDDFTLKIELK
jgi:ribonuclease inhibitor